MMADGAPWERRQVGPGFSFRGSTLQNTLQINTLQNTFENTMHLQKHPEHCRPVCIVGSLMHMLRSGQTQYFPLLTVLSFAKNEIIYLILPAVKNKEGKEPANLKQTVKLLLHMYVFFHFCLPSKSFVKMRKLK